MGTEARRRKRIGTTLRLQAAMKGNTNSFKNGMYSVVAIQDDVEATVGLLLAAGQGWLNPSRDLPMLMLTAEALVRWSKTAAVMDETPTTEITRVYSSCANRAMQALAMLGFTPNSAMQLGLHKLEAEGKSRELTEKLLERYRPMTPSTSSSPPEGSAPFALNAGVTEDEE